MFRPPPKSVQQERREAPGIVVQQTSGLGQRPGVDRHSAALFPVDGDGRGALLAIAPEHGARELRLAHNKYCFISEV